MQLNPDKVWFWSDTHFGHRAMLQFCRATRGDHADVRAMNSWLKELWLFAIPRDGVLIHLGDFSFMPHEQTMQLIQSMPGRVLFVRGNHDGKIGDSEIVPYYHNMPADAVRARQLKEGKLIQLGGLVELSIGGQKLVLCHFPLESWHGMHRGAWHLHGHCHGSLHPFGKRLDVGVDGPLGPGPIPFAKVREWMDRRAIFSRDHHQPKPEDHSPTPSMTPSAAPAAGAEPGQASGL